MYTNFSFNCIQVIDVHSKSFEVCDLDLLEVNQDIALNFSDYCKSLINNQLAIEESKLFAEFSKRLNELETAHDPNYNPNDPEGNVPAKLWQLRKQIYERNDYFACVEKNAAAGADEFYKCLANRRRAMTANIPKQ